MPILLISEPDIKFFMENFKCSFFDMNSVDCSAVICSLKKMGNLNATYLATSNKGFRKSTGARNPHSWSIADPKETVKWLLSY
jgi:hypothetical protein